MLPLSLQMIRRHLFFTVAQAGHLIGLGALGKVLPEPEWADFEEGTEPVPESVAHFVMDLVSYRDKIYEEIIKTAEYLRVIHKSKGGTEETCPSLPVLVYDRVDDFTATFGSQPGSDLPLKAYHWKPWNSAVAGAASKVDLSPVRFRPRNYQIWLGAKPDSQHMRHFWASHILHGRPRSGSDSTSRVVSIFSPRPEIPDSAAGGG